MVRLVSFQPRREGCVGFPQITTQWWNFPYLVVVRYGWRGRTLSAPTADQGHDRATRFRHATWQPPCPSYHLRGKESVCVVGQVVAVAHAEPVCTEPHWHQARSTQIFPPKARRGATNRLH